MTIWTITTEATDRGLKGVDRVVFGSPFDLTADIGSAFLATSSGRGKASAVRLTGVGRAAADTLIVAMSSAGTLDASRVAFGSGGTA